VRRFSKSSAWVLAAFLLSACVSTHMKKYIGKDVRYIAVDSGQPVHVFDMPDGKRAFQYYWGGGTYEVPKTTTTDGRVQLVGDSAYYSERKVETGGMIISSPGCLITYFAEWNPTSKGWVVVDISYPRRALVC
jgi:hypothetical protein